MKMTDLELTNYLIEMEVVGAEGLLETWERRTRYDNMDSLASLHKLTLTIHESVEFEINPKTGNPYGGSKPRNILGALRDEAIKKEDKREDNGYQETDAERMIRAIMLNTLIKKKESLFKPNHEHGLSYSGWATFFNFPKIEETESFELQASDYLEDCYNIAGNEFFKPTEIVNETQRAFAVTTKSTISNAFGRIPKIKTEIFYMAGVPDKKNKNNITFKVIDTETYKGMRELRKEILEVNGSNVNEYFGHLKKKKDERMKKIFKAVEDGLEFEYGATRFHESIKVELIEPESLVYSIYFDSIQRYFFEHFIERSIKYRHGNKNYKTSTYFWQRFYYMNVCYLLQFLDSPRAIDSVLFEKERASFDSNFANYLYGFDTKYYLEAEMLKYPFFGDMEKEIERRHYVRLKDYQSVIKLKEEEIIVNVCVDDESAYEVYEEDRDTRLQELIARLKAEPVNDVDIVLGDMFGSSVTYNHIQIEPIVDAIDSNNDENLSTFSISQPEIESSLKEVEIEAPMKFTGENEWLNKFPSKRTTPVVRPEMTDEQKVFYKKMAEEIKTNPNMIDIGAITGDVQVEPIKQYKPTPVFGLDMTFNILPPSNEWAEEEKQIIDESNESQAYEDQQIIEEIQQEQRLEQAQIAMIPLDIVEENSDDKRKRIMGGFWSHLTKNESANRTLQMTGGQN